MDHLAEARLILLDLELQADPLPRFVRLDRRFAGSLRQRVVIVIHCCGCGPLRVEQRGGEGRG